MQEQPDMSDILKLAASVNVDDEIARMLDAFYIEDELEENFDDKCII